VVSCFSVTLPEINQRKQGEAGESWNDFSLSACVRPWKPFLFRNSGPEVPAAHSGPRSDKMRSLLRCVSCSRRRCGRLGSRAVSGRHLGAQERSTLTGTPFADSVCELPFRIPIETYPLPRQNAQTHNMCPVEAHADMKIALRESGLRPLRCPSSPVGR